MSIADVTFTTAGIRARTPFKAEFVTELKDAIPFAARQWEPDDKVWIVAPRYEAELFRILRRHYSDVRINDERGARSQKRSGPPASPYTTLFLLPSAPPELAESAYRTLARMFHPDMNHAPNANEKMREINLAIEAIREGASDEF